MWLWLRLKAPAERSAGAFFDVGSKLNGRAYSFALLMDVSARERRESETESPILSGARWFLN